MIRSDAIFSRCGRYRYRLERVWDLRKPILPWVLLNGSTAGKTANDPTLVRLIGYSRRWDFGGLWLVNAYGAVATRPEDLFAMDDNLGIRNQFHVQRTIREAHATAQNLNRQRLRTPRIEPAPGHSGSTLPVIVGWGNHGARRGHDHRVMDWIRNAGPPVAIQCLGVTKRGCPVHPLYRRADAPRIPYEGRTRVSNMENNHPRVVEM